MSNLVIGNEKRSSPNSHFISKHPGEYKCVVVNDGDAVREVYFTATDGKIAGPCDGRLGDCAVAPFSVWFTPPPQ